VNVFDADCAVVTGIALDHTQYLGPIENRSGARRPASFAPAGRPSSAIPSHGQCDRTGESAARRSMAAGRDFKLQGDRQQWSWSGRAMRYSGLAHPALRGANQLLNAPRPGCAGVAARALAHSGASGAQRTGIGRAAGRFQIVPGQPVLCSMWRTTRKPRPRWPSVSTKWLLPAHAGGVRRDGDKDILASSRRCGR